jgi:hypothetical protein
MRNEAGEIGPADAELHQIVARAAPARNAVPGIIEVDAHFVGRVVRADGPSGKSDFRRCGPGVLELAANDPRFVGKIGPDDAQRIPARRDDATGPRRFRVVEPQVVLLRSDVVGGSDIVVWHRRGSATAEREMGHRHRKQGSQD